MVLSTQECKCFAIMEEGWPSSLQQIMSCQSFQKHRILTKLGQEEPGVTIRLLGMQLKPGINNQHLNKPGKVCSRFIPNS